MISIQSRIDRVWYRVSFDHSTEYEGVDLKGRKRCLYRKPTFKERIGFPTDSKFLWKRTDPLRQRNGVKPVRYFTAHEMDQWCQREMVEALAPMGIPALALVASRLGIHLRNVERGEYLEANLQTLGSHVWARYLRDGNDAFVFALTLFDMLKMQDIPIVDALWGVEMDAKDNQLPTDAENYRNNTLLRRMIIALHYSIPVGAPLTSAIVVEHEVAGTLNKFTA